MDIDENVKILTSLNEGVLYKNHKVDTAIKPSSESKLEIPVALISRIFTNSAGEFGILGFRGRKNTIIIGEGSYGSTTANELYEIPFGIKAAIIESYGTDRSAVYTKTITPDLEVKKTDELRRLIE